MGNTALITNGLPFGYKHNRKGEVVLDGDEYTTPEWLLNDVRFILSGHESWRIYLDPATSEQANVRVKAKKIYTKEDSGLTGWWNDQDYVTVFLNPPYSQPLRDRFVERCLQQYNYNPKAMHALALLNVGTETGAIQELLRYSKLSHFFDHRISFDHPALAEPAEQNRHSQAMFLLTEDPTVERRMVVRMRDKGVLVRGV